jgi:hypothetical protein
MNLVCDLLDQPVLDRHRRPMGRVDGIVLEVRPGSPPRVASLLIGPRVLGERLHPVIGWWVTAIEDACGFSRGRPVEISPSQFTIAEGEVHVDLAIGETAAGAVEDGVRRWIGRLPGAR